MIAQKDLRHHEEHVLLRAALESVRLLYPGKDFHAVRQVPMGTRRADIVVRVGNRMLIAVELKMDDWSRALAQATLNQLWTDRSYIAIPYGLAATKAALEASRYGIGVIAIWHGGTRVLCRARTSSLVEKSRREEMMRLLGLARV